MTLVKRSGVGKEKNREGDGVEMEGEREGERESRKGVVNGSDGRRWRVGEEQTVTVWGASSGVPRPREEVCKCKCRSSEMDARTFGRRAPPPYAPHSVTFRATCTR